MKRCPRCKEVSEFSSSWCKACNAEYAREYRRKYPERVREIRRKHYQKRKDYYREYYRNWQAENAERWKIIRERYRKNAKWKKMKEILEKLNT